MDKIKGKPRYCLRCSTRSLFILSYAGRYPVFEQCQMINSEINEIFRKKSVLSPVFNLFTSYSKCFLGCIAQVALS